VPAGAHAVAVVLLAVALDLAFGDPPDALHPVAWMGRAIGAGRRRLCRGGPIVLFVAGGAVTLIVVAAAGLAGWLLTSLGGSLGLAGVVLEAFALKSTLALRGLAAAAREVADALRRGDLAAARASVGRHLVSRPTATLRTEQVSAATIESLAENLTDAFVAPLVFYLVLGLPGALVYRALNTADSMLGYREGALEYFGKVAARLDDVANLIPARLAALALVAAAGRRAPTAWSTALADRRRTASPNAGWTMAAMAGALGVTLAKPGAYSLGSGDEPGVADIDRALGLLRRAIVLVLLAAVMSLMVASYVSRSQSRHEGQRHRGSEGHDLALSSPPPHGTQLTRRS
jgi:adenosylcobinamide-phosphate synthase